MLKKVIIGVVCFIILAVTAVGIYVYTLDWNKHKTVVENRFSQITGLKAIIDGNLKVELLPSPKFSANKVKFSKPGAGSSPLIVVNDISAHVNLMALFHSNFILTGMTLTGATVNATVDDKGTFNWHGVGSNGTNKSGNVEVSFNDIRLTNSTFVYKNLQEKDEFTISNISASISAPSLKGPYKTDGKFIHNNSEVKFKGNIIKDKNISLNLTLENASTGAKTTLEGSLGNKAKGSVTFDAPHLIDTAGVIFGDGALSEHYEGSLYFSFKYDKDGDVTKLDNFNVAYGKQTKGTGSIVLTAKQGITDIVANMDMSQFDLDLMENIASDLVSFSRNGGKFSETDLAKYSGSFNLKADKVFYRKAEAKDFVLATEFQDSKFNFNRVGVILPGNTDIKLVGNTDLTEGITYQFNQDFSTDDLRTFVSLFDVDLSKYATQNDKKAIFKKASADKITMSGNLNQLKISLPAVIVDAINLSGNVGVVFGNEKNAILADIKAEKILFDKYMEVLPQHMKEASFEEKLVYQFNLIPWSHDLDVDARFTLNSGVYNQLALENLLLEFKNYRDTLDISKLLVQNLAGANINLSLSASNIYKEPYFKELSYDIKTDKFSKFAKSIGLDFGNKTLFKRDSFASQGALSGTLNDFSLSSVQKFGDTEFSYTGTVKDMKQNAVMSGDLELKSENFAALVKALDIDYKPDLPVTTFALTGKINGSLDNFTLNNLGAYLGANSIKGNLSFNNTDNMSNLSADLNFDKFDADRLFSLNNKSLFYTSGTDPHTFIAKPVIYDEKIDYASLKNLQFDIRATAKQLVYRNKTYTDAQINALLDKGKLSVNEFKTQADDSNINLQFVLDTNNMPNIEGSYAVKAIHLPSLGGSLYALDGGLIDADGTFKSSAVSQKAFFENLTSYGKFQIFGTSVKGWDLDIIKFELEQRNSLEGFEDSVLNSLKNGHSSFTKIQGKYDISKGLLVTENTLWDSPVVNINMKLDLNLETWLFNAVFSAVYNNASFSDVLKYTFSGDLSNPAVTTDLKESIDRISETENMIQTAKVKEEKKQRAKLSGKVNELQAEINRVLRSIAQLSLDVARFKPITNNANVVKIYETSVNTINETEVSLNKMLKTLKNNPDEKTLMALESDLASDKSKLTFIPKTLEDNFVVDSKYVFDDTFNKIAWIYNVAQNNSSYYASLTEAYMEQIYMMDSTDTPVSKEKQDELSDDIQAVMLEMDKITALHNKIRESYLTIIDASKVSEMKENNELADQALSTILSYTEHMNKKIIESIDAFSIVLDIQSRDYDDYMVYLPKDAKDIDVSKPTIHVETKSSAPKEEKTDKSVKEQNQLTQKKSEEEQKIQPQAEKEQPSETQTNAEKATVPEQEKVDVLSLNEEPKNGLFSLISKIKTAKEEDTLSSNLQFAGLSDALNQSIQANEQPTLALNVVADIQEEKQAEKPLNDIVTADASELIPSVQEEEKSEISSQNEDSLKTAEKKTLDNPGDLFLADIEELKDTIPEQPVQAQSIQENANQTLINNTQTAMNEILQNIKKTEEGFQTLLSEHQKDIAKNKLVEKTTDIKIPDNVTSPMTDFVQSRPENGKTKLKVNPVIALGIGKNSLTEQEQKLAARLNEKTGFKKNNDATPQTKEASKSDLKPTAEIKNTPKKETHKIAKAQTKKDEKVKKSTVADAQSLRKDVLKSMLAYEIDQNVSSPRAHKLIEEAPVYVNDEVLKDHQQNRYVFVASNPHHQQVSGLVKKSMYAHIKNDTPSKADQKYLFAVNDTFYSSQLQGTITKNVRLYVK